VCACFFQRLFCRRFVLRWLFATQLRRDLILDGIYHAQLVELLELELSNAQPLLDDPCATLQANLWGHYALL
jgi:hypothetical protein